MHYPRSTLTLLTTVHTIHLCSSANALLNISSSANITMSSAYIQQSQDQLVNVPGCKSEYAHTCTMCMGVVGRILWVGGCTRLCDIELALVTLARNGNDKNSTRNGVSRSGPYELLLKTLCTLLACKRYLALLQYLG